MAANESAATDVSATGAPATAATAVRTRRGPNVLQRWLDRYMLIIYTVLAVIYLMLPVALIILFSFNNPAGKSNIVWQGFTFKYWLNPLGVDGLPAGDQPQPRDRVRVHDRSRRRSAPSSHSPSSATTSGAGASRTR